MDNKFLVYIAGPIHSGQRATELNVRDALATAEALTEVGFAVYVPHLSMFWNVTFPHDEEFWLDLDRHIILRCDAVFRMPGASKGADMEERWACENGIPVFYDTAEMSRMLKDDGS